MSYIDKNLLPQERLVYRARLHWILYFPVILIETAAVLAFFAAVAQPAGERSGYATSCLSLVFLGLIVFVLRWIKDKTSEFGVTNERVLIKVGVISRKSLELLLRQIEGVSVEQGIAGRVLGYGTITVVGTGGTKEPFNLIADPMEFRKQVQAQTVNGDSPRAATAPSFIDEKTCPACAEQVKRAARICRFCHYQFE